MRPAIALLLVAFAVAGCQVDAGSDEVVESSAYTHADGRVFSATDCPAAANLLVGGYDAADALPMKGQTDRARVEALLGSAQEHFVGSNHVTTVNLVERNGEVWFRLASGDYAVEQAADYQYEVVIGTNGVCPPAPTSWNDIPLLYNHAGT